MLEIRWSAVVPLLATSLALMGSPGPTTISLLAAGSAYGIQRSLAYLLGTILGTTTILLAVATGVTVALLAVPGFGSVLIGVSAAYILWLAYHVATAPPLSMPTAASKTPAFAGGALIGVANPKAWVAIAAVFASAHLFDDPAADATVKIALLSAMIIAICTTWLVAGRSLARVFRDPRRGRVVNAGLATTLVGATALAILH